MSTTEAVHTPHTEEMGPPGRPTPADQAPLGVDAPAPDTEVERGTAARSAPLRLPPEDAARTAASLRGATRVALLGQGGFGTVWKVRYLNCEEAWKYVRKGPGVDVRVLREAASARGVPHSSIVRVLGVEEDEAHFILRMDLVRGRDLHRVVSEDGVLPPWTACRLMLEAAEALEAAHRSGILHRDLKPSNLILKEDPLTLLITDFGVAARLRDASGDNGAPANRGTPYFLAPEELDAKRDRAAQLGPAVDVWALGITFYYLLSRTYPFEFRGADTSSILTDPPRPIGDLVPYAPLALWSILARMLRRDPAERYSTMEALANDLGMLLHEIRCPACSRSFPLEQVQNRCPNESCQQPMRVAMLKEQEAALRCGQDAHATCRFEAAAHAYERAAAIGEIASGEIALEANRLLAEASRQKDELAARLVRIRALCDREDWLTTLVEVDHARALYSAESELRRLRTRVVAEICGRHDKVAEEVAALVRAARFGEAKQLLGTVQGYLQYAPIRRLLSDPAETTCGAPVLPELVAFVAEHESLHCEWRAELDECLRLFDLKGAVACLQRLESRFPSQATRDHMRLLTDLAECWETLDAEDVDGVCALLDAPESSAGRVEVLRLLGLCDLILLKLSSTESAEIERVARWRDELESRVGAFQQHRTCQEERMHAARAAARLGEESDALAELVRLSQATDLFSPEDAAALCERYGDVRRAIERCLARHAEAERFIAERDYEGALVALEAVEVAAPDLFPDLGESIRLCQERIARNRSLGERLSQAYHRLLAEPVTPAEHGDFFALVAQAEAEHDQRVDPELQQRVDRILGRLVAHCRQIAAGAGDAARALGVFRQTVDVLERVPRRFLQASLDSEDTGARAELGALAASVLDALELSPRSEDGPARVLILVQLLAELRRAHGWIDSGAGSGPGLRVLARWSRGVLEAARDMASDPNVSADFKGLESAYVEALELSQDPRQRKALESDRAAIRRLFRSRTRPRRRGLAAAWAARILVPAACAVLAASFALEHGRRAARSERVALAESLVRGLLGRDGTTLQPEDLRMPESSAREITRDAAGLEAFITRLLGANGIGTPATTRSAGATTIDLVGRLQRRGQLARAIVGLHSGGGSGALATWDRQLASAVDAVLEEAAIDVSALVSAAAGTLADRTASTDITADPWRPAADFVAAVEAALDAAAELRSAAGQTGADDVEQQARLLITEIETIREGAALPSTPAAGPPSSATVDVRFAAHAAGVAATLAEIAGLSLAMRLGSLLPEDGEVELRKALARVLAARTALERQPDGMDILRRIGACRFLEPEPSQDPIATGTRRIVADMLRRGD